MPLCDFLYKLKNMIKPYDYSKVLRELLIHSCTTLIYIAIVNKSVYAVRSVGRIHLFLF